MYTLGGLVVSADDDMRPYTLMEHSPESLDSDEVCRGRLHKACPNGNGCSGTNGYGKKSFDIIASFLDVLGKRVSQVPDNYERGELLVDTAMDLETNATKGLHRENSLVLRRGPLAEDAVVRMAQTFRSGTNDIDAIDFVDMFLSDEGQTNPDDLNDVYVLVNFRPAVTKRNWRMDCGVAGYDNSFGLPPFFPTRLRLRGLHLPPLGSSSPAWRPPTSTRPRITRRATTCGIRRRPRSSTRKCRTSSSGRFSRACRGWTSCRSHSTTTAR